MNVKIAPLLIGLGLFVGACNPLRTKPTSTPEIRSFTILAVNDVYRIGGIDGGEVGGLSRLRALRTELEHETPDLLLLHAGDFLFPSLASRWFLGEQMVDVMNLLDGDNNSFDENMFVTFGNHEFDKDAMEDAPMLDQRIEESQFYWLGSNIDFVTDNDQALFTANHLLPSKISEHGGVRVGLFSVTLDEKFPEYVQSFGDPTEVAREMTAELRQQGAEVVVGLSHLTISEDMEILRQLGDDGPDLLIGGHEHNQQEKRIGGRLVLKADADAVSATVARIAIAADGAIEVTHEFRDLGPDSLTDPHVDARIEYWDNELEKRFCSEKNQAPGCLEKALGKTRVRLDGEELEIRRFETNFGNWIVDRALERFADRGAQVAFVNSGGLRLNQDIPAGSDVTVRHIEETFQYPSGLRLMKMKGSVLQQVIEHSVTDWTGNGKWLQIAGFAFRHDPQNGKADRLTLLTAHGPRPVDPEEELIVVTNDFLTKPKFGQDGYTMLTPDLLLEGDGEEIALRDLVVAGLEAAGNGITPAVEGRICNLERSGPCLAVER